MAVDNIINQRFSPEWDSQDTSGREDLAQGHDEAPETGAAIGLAGGAIVGVAAGGPPGAIVGAVAGAVVAGLGVAAIEHAGHHHRDIEPGYEDGSDEKTAAVEPRQPESQQLADDPPRSV